MQGLSRVSRKAAKEKALAEEAERKPAELGAVAAARREEARQVADEKARAEAAREEGIGATVRLSFGFRYAAAVAEAQARAAVQEAAKRQAAEDGRLKAEEAARKATEGRLKSEAEVRERAEKAGADLTQERARIQALEQQLAVRRDDQKLLAQERARIQALEQQLAAREDEQKLLAQERARNQALEQQLAVRRDPTPDRGRTPTASPLDRPASMPPGPGPDKPVTAPLPISDKPLMPANRLRTLTARPINVVLAVLLVVGGCLVGRTRVTYADAPRDAATAPVGMLAAAAATPEVTEPKVIERPGVMAPPLSSGELRELQAWLKVLGCDPGPADGLVGDRTTAAIRYYQRARQLEETGVPDRTLLRHVRKDMGH